MKSLSQILSHFLVLICVTSCVPKNSEKGSEELKRPSEKKVSSLKAQLESADTILLVTHEQTYGPVLNKKTKKYEEAKRLVLNNTINQKVIQEIKLIEGADRDLLSSILTQEIKGSPIILATCFEPHHAIILIKKKSVSYLEICFSCGGVSTDELDISSADFDNDKWDRLYKFIDPRIKFKE